MLYLHKIVVSPRKTRASAHLPSSNKATVSPPPTSRGDKKRIAIISAATLLFSQYGFRKTSVDLVAQKARVAKPTIYAHFVDKEALFVAVCEQLVEQVVIDAQAACATPSLEQRLFDILAAKYTKIFELVHASPHAAELLSSQNLYAAQCVDDADARYRALLTQQIENAVNEKKLDLSRANVTPDEFVSVLMQCAYGAGYLQTTAAQHKAALKQALHVLLLGATPIARLPMG